MRSHIFAICIWTCGFLLLKFRRIVKSTSKLKMTVLSMLKPLSSMVRPSTVPQMCKRFGSHGKTMDIQPSRYGYHQFKNFLYFYVMLGVIPLSCVSAYCNLFIGPATLTETPEGYDPRDEEYHRHPITRWIVRNSWANYRELYERTMHCDYVEYERMALRRLSAQVETAILRNDDVKGYNYVGVASKYYKYLRTEGRSLRNYFGWNS